MSIALLLAINTQSVFWLPLVAFFSFGFLFYSEAKRKDSASISIAIRTSSGSTATPTSLPFLGSYANQITAFRFLLSTGTALCFPYLPELLSFCLFGLAILLDGLDGYLARKYQQTSEIGALFDKTVDAYFVLLLAFILGQTYEIPFWFLAIGYLHYGYELLLVGLGWQYLSTPKNPIGKYTAAILFLSLLSPFILPQSWFLPIIYLASILVCLSFGLSFWYKYRVSVNG